MDNADTATLIVISITVTALAMFFATVFYWGPQVIEGLKHVHNDFISSKPDNNTMILTTTNSTSTLETELFWNQVKIFQSQGWNITDVRFIDESEGKTQVIMTK